MLNSSALQLRLQALADLARAGSTHALPVRPAQETGDSHECIFVFRYLFWRDAVKIAGGRFKFLVSLWEDRSGNTDLRPLYARPGAEMVREEWTEWRGRGIRPETRNFDDRWDL
jgi:hypothetical protein